MRAIVAERFGGYQNLKLADIPQPTVSNGRVLVRITAAGVTPLDHTILSGDHPRAKAPLVLGNEGAALSRQAETTGFRMVPGLCSRGHTVSTRMARSVNGLR
jgi:NADPH2:quinone reductase